MNVFSPTDECFWGTRMDTDFAMWMSFFEHELNE